MNIKLPVVVIMNKLTARLAEIESAEKQVKAAQEKYVKDVAAWNAKFLKSAALKNAAPHFGYQSGYYEDNAVRTVTYKVNASDLPDYPEHPKAVPMPKGNVEDIRRCLDLLKDTTSVDVSIKSIKGMEDLL